MAGDAGRRRGDRTASRALPHPHGIRSVAVIAIGPPQGGYFFPQDADRRARPGRDDEPASPPGRQRLPLPCRRHACPTFGARPCRPRRCPAARPRRPSGRSGCARPASAGRTAPAAAPIPQPAPSPQPPIPQRPQPAPAPAPQPVRRPPVLQRPQVAPPLRPLQRPQAPQQPADARAPVPARARARPGPLRPRLLPRPSRSARRPARASARSAAGSPCW